MKIEFNKTLNEKEKEIETLKVEKKQIETETASKLELVRTEEQKKTQQCKLF